MTPEQDRDLLYHCIVLGRQEELVQEFWIMVNSVVIQTFKIYKVPYSDNDVEDLRNDVFIRLLDKNCKKLRQYTEDLGNGLAAWIKLIAIQTVQNHIRTNDIFNPVYRHSIQSLEELLNLFDIPSENSQEKEFLQKEKQLLLKKGIGKLSKPDALLMTLYYFDGFSLSDIASYMKKSRTAIDTQKSRALKKLKKIMKKLLKR